ncbi:MAG: ATP-binding protein [candidate division KSB1 bacterium]|nr:ATP-binding protein [candidate division KSB1 bacterium]MDZ7407010.1 ATP-binding protein [candidate division KSB1 bacterium]
MARSDLLINLVQAATRGDQTLLKKTVEALVAEERAKQHHVLAERLAEYLKGNGSISFNALGAVDSRIQDLLFEITPNRKLQDLILPEVVQTVCQELIEEHHRRELLRSYNLEPRHRVLLAGPPGNGKTSLAEALAEALMVPMLVVRYEGVIGSYLGETASRLQLLFEYVRTRRCVLFLDEFDVLGKERGDVHETGEIKRVVSSLLLQIDALPSHVVVVTASNHPELLDRAVWRRFQLRLPLPPPGIAQLEKWLCFFETRLGEPLGYTPRTLAEKLKGLSFAEVEEFGTDILRRHVLAKPNSNLKQIVSECLKQWQARFKVTETTREQDRKDFC